MDSDELWILLECYKTLYPREEVELSSSVACKYSNIRLGTEKFGSKLDCRNMRSARIMASWTAEDGSIDISAPCRPGVVNCYVAHSVKLNGEFYQHVFAVIWWYKTDRDQDHFGKPTKQTYVHCGPALFMPAKRIKNKFASCCSVKLNGEEKLVVSPIPRLFH